MTMREISSGVKPSHWLGGYVADLPTPFDDADEIDWPAFEMLCEHQIGSGATAMIVGETMGEASTLSRKERGEIIGAAVRLARGRIAVIAGAGSNSTGQAIELTAIAEREGADAIMSVVPYYNKPMQAGILAHFQSVAASTRLPIILHDVPSRTAREMSDETIIRLAESPQFVGLNDATGSVARLFRLRSRLPSGFRLTCGGDADALRYLASGGDGCISGMANLFPDLCDDIHEGCIMGDLISSRDVAARLAPLGALLAGDSPVAVLKYGMGLLGFMKPAVRLPLAGLSDDARKMVAQAIAAVAEPGKAFNARSA
ncbi:MAG: 4-hydroxy-tetrahydrodipicolinate synthase [Bradyrhizobium sp.]